MQKGKLVVIEGSDGSGKATQLKLLIQYLKQQQIPFSTLDFPQYKKTFFGKWLRRFLDGEFGRLEEIPPQLVSFPYAADRWQAKDEIKTALNKKKVLLVNRYVGSNAVYQSAKLATAKRADFVDWVQKMEYEIFGIPREDLVIFLYVPVEISQKLMDGRGKKDIHEANIKLLQEVEKEYLGLCQKYKHWVKIECCVGGKILPKEEIHQKILEVLKQKKIL